MFKFKTISLAILIFYAVPTLCYGAFDGDCMSANGKFKDCKIDFKDESIIVEYKGKKESEQNVTIPGKFVTALSGGEYAKRRVASSVVLAVLLTPLALFGLLTKKKREQFGIEYTDANSKKSAVLFQVKKDVALGVKTNLQSITGKDIDYGPQNAAKAN